MSQLLDPVSLLCNEAQQRGLAPPIFSLVKIDNISRPSKYTWSCRFMGLTSLETGHSRREARALAAKAIMAMVDYQSLPAPTCRSDRRQSALSFRYRLLAYISFWDIVIMFYRIRQGQDNFVSFYYSDASTQLDETTYRCFLCQFLQPSRADLAEHFTAAHPIYAR
jgi:hypothetical protein